MGHIESLAPSLILYCILMGSVHSLMVALCPIIAQHGWQQIGVSGDKGEGITWEDGELL